MNRKKLVMTAAAAAVLLGLSACTSDETDTASETTTAVETTATSGSSTTEQAEESAQHSEADVMFAQMMIPHHQQAVDMSETLLAKDDIPADVQDFAQKVIDAQGPEIERMNQMLQTWEAPMPAEDSTSMDHGTGGMMSEEDMGMLNDAQGTDAARLYLEQMTVHHEGAVEMAQEQIEQGQNPQAVELARQVVEDQEAEITEMEQMLQELPDGS